MNANEISAALVRRRKYKNWSQMIMAGKLGRHRTAVTRVELDTAAVSLKLLLKYCELLDLELVIQPKKIKSPENELFDTESAHNQ